MINLYIILLDEPLKSSISFYIGGNIMNYSKELQCIIVADFESADIGTCHSYCIHSLLGRSAYIDVNKFDGYYNIFIDNGYPISSSYESLSDNIAKAISEIQEIGKYVIGNVVDATNRVFIDRISVYNSIGKKNGWWDTFSLSEETPSVGNGRYIFSISRFTEDKEGHPIAILKEVMPIASMSDEAAICMAINSSKFSKAYKDYFSRLALSRNNYEAVRNIDIFEELSRGVFDEKKFLELLNSKTPDEIDIDMLKEIRNDVTHPLYAKINRIGLCRDDLLGYVYRIRERYTTLGLGDKDTTIVAKAIAVEKYYNDLHKEAKKKKTEAKKAKKKNKERE